MILVTEDNVIKLKSLKVFAGTGASKSRDDFGGIWRGKKASETGDGPVDAIFEVLRNFTRMINFAL